MTAPRPRVVQAFTAPAGVEYPPEIVETVNRLLRVRPECRVHGPMELAPARFEGTSVPLLAEIVVSWVCPHPHPVAAPEDGRVD